MARFAFLGATFAAYVVALFTLASIPETPALEMSEIPALEAVQ